MMHTILATVHFLNLKLAYPAFYNSVFDSFTCNHCSPETNSYCCLSFTNITLLYAIYFSWRTMNVLFDNSALMTLSAWQEGYFIPRARAWTPHTWTKNTQLQVVCCDCILKEMFWECEAYILQYVLFCRGAPAVCLISGYVNTDSADCCLSQP